MDQTTDERPSLSDKIAEWATGNALWSFAMWVIGSCIVGLGGARLLDATINTAGNIALILIGVGQVL